MKCKQCKKGNKLHNKDLHYRCKPKWDANNIPKNQKRRLSCCPHCKKTFFYWQKASLHATENKHYGDYSIWQRK